MNVAEYTRVLSAGPRGKRLRFVYDVPELVEDDKAPKVFERQAAGGYKLSEASLNLAHAYGVAPKNVRGELPTIILTPRVDVVMWRGEHARRGGRGRCATRARGARVTPRARGVSLARSRSPFLCNDFFGRPPRHAGAVVRGAIVAKKKWLSA